MARRVHSRIRATWLLRTETPLRVGTGGMDTDVDLPIAVDGLQRPYVPGTGLAGSFRAWMEGVAPGGETDVPETGVRGELRTLWGHIDGDEGAASWLAVHDALILPDEHAAVAITDSGTDLETHAATVRELVEIVQSVGINRVSGTAAPGILYSAATLPRGVVIRVSLDADVPTAEAAARTTGRLRALEAALKRGEIRLGAGKTRGAGRVTVAASAIAVERLGTREGMLAALGLHDAPAGASADPGIEPGTLLPARRRIVKIEVTLRPGGTLMTRAPLDGFVIDTLPLVSRDVRAGTERLALVVPGASIKGAMRAAAERIVRTLRRLDAPDAGARTRRFLDQLSDPQLRLVHELFGVAPGTASPSPGADGPDAALGVSALSVDPIYGEQALTREQWEALIAPPPERTTADSRAPRERAELDSRLRSALRAQHLFDTTHVAIDRWTGGAASGLLYSIIEPRDVAWHPMAMALDLDRLHATRTPGVPAGHDGDPRAHPALALLLQVLAALQAGEIGVGFGVNRGMGTLVVETVRLRGLDPVHADRWMTLNEIVDDSAVFAPIDAAWTSWLPATRWWDEAAEVAR